MRNFCVVLGLVALVSPVFSQELSSLKLMPWPSSIQLTAGAPLPITSAFRVGIATGSDPHLQNTVTIFLNDLRRHTGMGALDFHEAAPNESAQLQIRAEHAAKEPLDLGEDESYTLTVTSSQAQLTAPTTLGVMRGLQTFLQLAQVAGMSAGLA